MISGGIAISVANPFDLVKVRFQGDVKNALLGQPQRYKNAREALINIVKTEGFFKLWTGVVPNINRTAIINASEVATYDQITEKLHDTIKSTLLLNLVGGICAGLCSIIVGGPMDKVKTRVMNQQSGKILD